MHNKPFQGFALPVRQGCIDNGVRHNVRQCPIAIAAREFFNPSADRTRNNTDVWVSTQGRINLIRGGVDFIFRAEFAQHFVLRYDSGRSVAPQTFYYELERVVCDAAR